MNELERFEGPISTGQSVPRLISRRLYNVVLTGIVLLSFVVMAASSHITATADFQIFVGNNALTYSVATIVASIVGIVLMNVARAKENLPIAVVGYALFALSKLYDLPMEFFVDDNWELDGADAFLQSHMQMHGHKNSETARELLKHMDYYKKLMRYKKKKNGK